MIDEPGDRTTRERRRASAQAALTAYRERRRRRRGDDTYFGSAACLLEPERAGEHQRRDELLAEAERAGMPADLADRLYEVAIDEGIDPGLGFDVVHCGLGVAPPDAGLVNAPDEPMTDPHLPEWFFPALPPDELLRERMLRTSFRRLRAMLERHAELDDALRAFADEPDVGYYGY